MSLQYYHFQLVVTITSIWCWIVTILITILHACWFFCLRVACTYIGCHMSKINLRVVLVLVPPTTTTWSRLHAQVTTNAIPKTGTESTMYIQLLLFLVIFLLAVIAITLLTATSTITIIIRKCSFNYLLLGGSYPSSSPQKEMCK